MDPTCPLCHGTNTQEIHGTSGFLSRNCPNCVVEDAAPLGYSPADDGPSPELGQASTETPPLNISTDLSGHVDGLTLNGADPTV